MAKTKNNSETRSTGNAPTIYKYSEVNFDNIEISEWNRDNRQPTAYINYSDEKLKATTKFIIQTDKIKITNHGIPRLSDKSDGYYKSDVDREFCKIPLDNTQANCNKLRAFFEKFDEWLGSAKMRKQLFGNNSKKFTYSPCIKTPVQPTNFDEDDKKERKDFPIVDFLKAKFNIVPVDDNRECRTRIIKADGSGKEEVQCSTITEVAELVSRGSLCKFILYLTRIWHARSPFAGSKELLYGASFKIMAIEVNPAPPVSIKSESIMFRDDSDDEDDVEFKSSDKKSPAKFNFHDSEDEESSSDDGDDNNDENANSESDDSEEEIRPKSTKSPKKKSKKDKSEEEEDDEEEETVKKSPKKSPTKKSSKKKAKEESEEEEEESSEELKKKSKKSKKKSKN